ncbi:FlaD/FlaE family flagellar protein [Halapricum desulfuricans]|nr:FlaD/FlaE family flagellar protein [Halapricum desulfuricans]
MSDFATVAALSSLVEAVMASTSDVSGVGQVALPGDPVVLTLFSAGVAGMSIKNVFDSILSDEDDGESEQMSDGAGLMDEEGGDDLGGLGGFEDEGDDEFGDFGDDEFGDMDGGPDTDELEHRLDELETEVGSLSSTVNTVRNENEQISETVDDVEENVRKLLDIYEMVTRGVNPFADDIEGGGLSGGDGDSFGLFDTDQQDDDGDEELDEDIANADAEGFFDDDLVDDDDGEFGESVEDVMGEEDLDGGSDPFEDDFDDEAFGEDDFDDEAFGEDDFDDGDLDEGGLADDFGDGGSDESKGDSDDGGGGKSFQELKDEYESGEADWAEEDSGDEPLEEETDESDGDDAAEAFDDEFDGETDAGDEFDGETDAGDALDDTGDETEDALDDELADDELFDTVIEDEGGAEVEPETEQTADEANGSETPESVEESRDSSGGSEQAHAEPTTDESAAASGQPNSTQTAESDDRRTAAAERDGKPYLATMPDGYGSELIVFEWLEYLVGEVGVRSTAEAIDYYERIDWLSEPVADSLQDYLRGFDDDSTGGNLTIDHHTRSLKYIGQLNGVPQVERMGLSGGGSDGLQP